MSAKDRLCWALEEYLRLFLHTDIHKCKDYEFAEAYSFARYYVTIDWRQ